MQNQDALSISPWSAAGGFLCLMTVAVTVLFADARGDFGSALANVWWVLGLVYVVSAGYFRAGILRGCGFPTLAWLLFLPTTILVDPPSGLFLPGDPPTVVELLEYMLGPVGEFLLFGVPLLALIYAVGIGCSRLQERVGDRSDTAAP
jgi:hypothetical protein